MTFDMNAVLQKIPPRPIVSAPKPIDTRYAGYLFRSRIEARWAVFFDGMGIPFEYEPEGFELKSGGWYLPDFKLFLPCGYVRWIEVKPEGGAPTETKAVEFAQQLVSNFWSDEEESDTGRPDRRRESMTIVRGDPKAAIDRAFASGKDGGVCPRCMDIVDSYAYGSMDLGRVMYIGCETCDFDTPSGGDNPQEWGVVGTRCYPSKGSLKIPMDDWSAFKWRLAMSARDAREARFENGRH